MDIDFDLYRHDVTVTTNPSVRLSVIDVAPDHSMNTVVMLHGFGGYALQWKYQLQALSESNRCIVPDLRGHGRSDKPISDYTVDEILHDLDSVLESLGVDEPIVLMGHSFGGALATTYAHRYPERVKRLILTATTGRYSLPFYTRLVLSLPTAVLNLVRPFIRRQISAPPLVLKRLWRNAMDRWNGWGMMRSLEMPVLVIRGDRDVVFPTADFEQVARVIPTAEEVNVGVSAHMVILERRDAVERAIDRFLGLGHASWRSGDHEGQLRAQLVAERPWLTSYEDSVPFTISIPNRPLSTLLSSAARRFGRRPAVIFGGTTLSYRDLEHEANRLANALRGMGVDTGTRVMLVLPNTPQWIIAFYGILKAGGTVVAASPAADEAEILREIKETDATILITLNRNQDMAKRVHVEALLEHIIYTGVTDYLAPLGRLVAQMQGKSVAVHGDLASEEREWLKLVGDYKANPLDVKIDPEWTAAIQYTGGTTDAPKGVMLSHTAMMANTFQTRHWVTGAKEGTERVLAVVPFAHSYGMTAAMNVAIAMGAAMITLPRFNTQEVLQTIRRQKPTIFPGVPTMYVAINNFPNVRRYNLRSIRHCISGAAPLPVEVQETFEKLTKARLVEGYGQTEAAPVTHANPLHGVRKVGSIGIPLPNTESRIVHLATGEPVEPGEVGEIVVRGPQVMQGYLGLPDETAAALRDGWLFTGDVGRMDHDGYYQVISRKKEVWYPERDDGVQQPAFPRDVEEVIYEIPEVKEAAVVGLERLAIAFVTTNRSLDSKTVLRYCERRLPPELVPSLVIFVDEMPRSLVGKIIRRHLLNHIPEPQRRELDIVSDRIDGMLDYPFNGSEDS